MTEDSPENDEQLLDIEMHEDRYHRLRLIPWWEQERLESARFLVVGAGALGNEIVKNLALLGIGNTMVVDIDVIEESNLTRSVLFRHGDEGKLKVDVAARTAAEINPDVIVEPRTADINYDIGLGVYREMDVVFGALDNREARVSMNSACLKMGVPFVDGAIEIIQGMVKVFVPGDEEPCYECTMSDHDYQLLNMRRSCALLSPDEILSGKVPTTPTTGSVIAGMQVQEAVKLLHQDRELPTLAGKGFFYDGYSNDSYVINYDYREDCPAHESIDDPVELDRGAGDLTAGEALEMVRSRVDPEAVVEFHRELCTRLYCPACDEYEDYFDSLGKLKVSQAECPHCGQMREPELTHSITGTEDYLDRTLAELGLPLYDVITGRAGWEMEHFLLAADRDEALGSIA
jgi:adenylyltransferase/sulfurtransferase